MFTKQNNIKKHLMLTDNCYLAIDRNDAGFHRVVYLELRQVQCSIIDTSCLVEHNPKRLLVGDNPCNLALSIKTYVL